MSRDPRFQADMSFQKQADTLSTKTDHGKDNKKQCSAKAKGRGVCQGEWWSKKSDIITGKGGGGNEKYEKLEKTLRDIMLFNGAETERQENYKPVWLAFFQDNL